MRIVASISLFLATVSAAQPNTPAPIEGLWRNPSETAIIEIAPCGGLYCGKVVWASERGQREAAKGAPQVVGTTVLTDLKSAQDGWAGTLFIPDDNIHVSATLKMVGNRQLKLTGCAIIGLFCRSQIWSRADGTPPSGN
jgi:uncharacterized protein (DUF2147 family)